jgi:hypothetical protein
MKVIRGKPAIGKPPEIICSVCGKRADEAGVAVPDMVLAAGIGIVELKMPLCADCVALLESELAAE